MKNKDRKIGAIILAAGRGSRMKKKNINKVAVRLNDRPIISYAISLLEKMDIKPIIVIVGHAKSSVQEALRDHDVIFAEQKRRLGTGHAIRSALPKITDDATDMLVLYGDDSYIYNEKILTNVINRHVDQDAGLTFFTLKVDDPSGLGRIIRDDKGEVIDIIEEKDATEEQRRIKEINPNCYIFKAEFLKKYVKRIPKSPVTGEYYLPSLIKLARDNKIKSEVVEGGFIPWRGVNTAEDLAEAHNIFVNLKD